MHAVVLVGGFGTRLRPLTLTTPKPLLPIMHRPMLEHLLGSLARAGVTDAVLALGFNPDPFFTAFPGDTCAGVRLSYAVEDAPLDTAGAIGFAARTAGIDSTFIVANGDVVTDLDVGSLVAFHREHGAEATISLTPVDDPSQFGIVETATDGRVLRFVEKPHPGETSSRNASAGTYVMEPRSLERMPGTTKQSIEREVFPRIVEEGGLFAMSTDDFWIDAGRPETYLAVNLRAAAHDASGAIDPAARVDHSARVLRSVVDAKAVVAAGAVVEDSVVLAGAQIGASAHVGASIIMGRVEQGATVIDAVVGRDGVVPAGATVSGVRIPANDGK
jgi:mannose-1-phosphate guanylyltransferase